MPREKNSHMTKLRPKSVLFLFQPRLIMTRERLNSSRRWKRSLLSPIIERKKSPPPKNKKFELHYIELSDYFESRSFFSLILFHFKSFLNSSLGFLYASRGLISNMAEGSNAQGLLWILPPRAQGDVDKDDKA